MESTQMMFLFGKISEWSFVTLTRTGQLNWNIRIVTNPLVMILGSLKLKLLLLCLILEYSDLMTDICSY